MPSYKLTYFHFNGRGSPIRLILVYAGIPFEDNRIDYEDWEIKHKANTPLGQVPVLEIDGKQYTQMKPLCRYLATITDLYGNTPLENLAIDTVFEILWDILKTAYDFKFFEPDEARQLKLMEKLDGQLLVLLGKLEEDTKKNGGFIALNRITFADLVFLAAYEDLENIVPGRSLLANYPNLEKLKKKLLENKNIREFLQKRPPNKYLTIYDLKDDL